MKDIHPTDYRTILFYDTSAKHGWLIRSCAKTTKTMVWEEDGQEYPVFLLDTSAVSHPAYTGKASLTKSEGQVKKFMDRYQNVGIKKILDK